MAGRRPPSLERRSAVRTDIDWVREQSRLLDKAQEWTSTNRASALDGLGGIGKTELATAFSDLSGGTSPEAVTTCRRVFESRYRDWVGLARRI